MEIHQPAESLDPSEYVSSINTLTGDVLLAAGTGISITPAGQTLTIASTVVSPVDGGGTANEITYWVDANTVGSLTTATYPSLTELSYVKGVTSAVQTQLSARVLKAGDTMTGALLINGSSNTTQLKVTGNATQTSNVVEFYDQAYANPTAFFNKNGTLEVRNRVTGNDGRIVLTTGVNPSVDIRGDVSNGYYPSINFYWAGGANTGTIQGYNGLFFIPAFGFSVGAASYYNNTTAFYVKNSYVGANSAPMFKVQNVQGANNPFNVFQDGSITQYGATASINYPMAKRTGVSATSSGSGSSFGGGVTYYYKVTASNFVGETIGSAEVSTTPTAGQNNVISWTYANLEGVDHYHVYRSTTAGSYSASSRVDTVPNGALGIPYYIVSFTDTGYALSAGTPPTAITFDTQTYRRWEGQTGALIDFEDETGTTIAQVRSDGGITVGNTVRLKGYTVATLPTGVVGDTAYVTDALAPTFGTAVTGGGAITMKVFYNGANWIVG